MPHIAIKCYPKGLNEQQLQSFADDLTAFVSERLNTPDKWITIDYQKLSESDWREQVYDAEVKPNGGHRIISFNLSGRLKKQHFQTAYYA